MSIALLLREQLAMLFWSFRNIRHDDAQFVEQVPGVDDLNAGAII